jgi:PEP-CTERM motif
MMVVSGGFAIGRGRAFDARRGLRAGLAASALAALALFAAPGAKADSLDASVTLPTFQVDGQLNDWGINVKNGTVSNVGSPSNTTGATTYPCGGSPCQSVTGVTVPKPPLYQPGVHANPAGAGGVSNGIMYNKTNEITSTSTSPQIVTPAHGAINPFVEDSDDAATSSTGNWAVGPEYGGQNYDTEFLGAAVQQHGSNGLNDATMYLAILSGLRPDSGANQFGPGDIFLHPLDKDGTIVQEGGKDVTFAIEVGGGSAGSPANQSAGGNGWTYNVDPSSGYTASVAESTAADGLNIGDIVKITDAANQVIMTPAYLGSGNTYAVQIKDSAFTHSGAFGSVTSMMDNWTAGSCNQIDPATGASNGTATCDQHSIIELAFEMGLFGSYVYLDGGQQHLAFSVYWGPACGNDVVATEFDIGWREAPEPGTLAIFAVGLLGLGFPMARARRRKPVRAA